jgi:hypothetical protein
MYQTEENHGNSYLHRTTRRRPNNLHEEVRPTRTSKITRKTLYKLNTQKHHTLTDRSKAYNRKEETPG